MERSSDGNSFQKIGTVKPNNNTSITSNYSFVDMNAPSDLNYYRIRFVDIDGSYTFSPVKQCRAAATQQNMIVSSGKNITATFKKSDAGIVSLFDMQGKLLSKQEVAQGAKNIVFACATFSPGTYIVRFNSAISGQTISTRVILTK
jgi:hypothetical protein